MAPDQSRNLGPWNTPSTDIFSNGQGEPRLLRGVSIYSGSSRLAELAARIGFETVWIEMEHGPTDFALAEHICMAVEAAGALPTVRICDGQRTNVLRALEIGARIVIVPIVQSADQAQAIVEYGKFPPLGQRGYNTRSRGVNYGLGNVRSNFLEANDATHLFAQIETVQAVKNLDSICAVAGLSGIFIGPGDLSASLGVTGDFKDSRVISTITDCIRRARDAGKHAGILAPPGPLIDAAINAGCDLVFFGGDLSDLTASWQKLLASLPAKAERR